MDFSYKRGICDQHGYPLEWGKKQASNSVFVLKAVEVFLYQTRRKHPLIFPGPPLYASLNFPQCERLAELRYFHQN